MDPGPSADGAVADSEPEPAGWARQHLLELYRRMLRIRGFEERVAALYRDGHVPGFVHVSIGQEAA
ncbi:MAG TPA: ABC transporter substrate-binding protein, partial [Acidimicrobiia bacterium]|nr:ABC transporter substrate-binding protein [Acidimicrobiia bacterium]